jgi:hypothetical protein
VSEQGDEPPRVPLADAATRLGKSQEAVRAMIRRGKLATIRGNDGRLLVTVPPELVRAGDQPSPDGGATSLDEALAEAEHWRDRAHRSDLEATSARAELTVRLEQIAELREQVGGLRAELAESRRPWWRRWLIK